MKRFALIAAAVLGLASPSFAGDVVSIENVWSRASAGPARAGAAFLTVKNTGEADKLIAAKADVSKRVELHTHLHEDGVMKMRQVEYVPVPANGMAMLKPGGYHVMFMGLKEPFKEGQSFPLTLVFEKAGEVQTTVSVQKAGAMGAMKHGMKHDMKHGKDSMKHSH